MHLRDIDDAWLDLIYSARMEDHRINNWEVPKNVRHADKIVAIVQNETPYKVTYMRKEKTDNGYRLYDFVEMPF